MGTERDGTAKLGADVRKRQQELLRSLHAAAETLSLCVERIEDLISRVDHQMLSPESSPARPPAQVSFGGGASVLGSRVQNGSAGLGESSDGSRRSPDPDGSLGFHESLIRSDERRRAVDRRADRDERRTGVEERPAGVKERRGTGEPRTPRQSERRAPGTPALMMATELAHLGYSREEIGERLRARWGERAAAIMTEALDEGPAR